MGKPVGQGGAAASHRRIFTKVDDLHKRRGSWSVPFGETSLGAGLPTPPKRPTAGLLLTSCAFRFRRGVNSPKFISRVPEPIAGR